MSIVWDSSPSLKSASRHMFSRGFTPFHSKLLDICFGHYRPDPNLVQPLDRQNGSLQSSDLDKLMYMVLVEFTASLEKEIAGTKDESHAKPKPNVYDVFVMKTTFGNTNSNKAVVMPMRGGQLQWWDGHDGLTPLGADLEVYRIASLVGTVRVLEALSRAKNEQVQSLTGWAMRREMLVDVVKTKPRMDVLAQHEVDPSIINHLNLSQQEAVRTVMSPIFQKGFFAIQGPPGCGKTTTMASMISAIGRGMVVAAPSNAAVANIAIKLYKDYQFKFGDMCVFGDGCDDSVRFLNPRHRSDKFYEAFSRYMEIDDQIAQNDRKTETWQERKKESIRQEIAEWLHIDQAMSMMDLRNLCPHIEVDATSRMTTKKGKDVIETMLRKARVVLCTLNSSGSRSLQKAVSSENFQTFLLDEAGQSTEAEFYIATTFPGVKRIVVMGDPKQLRPTVLEPTCSKAGFSESWLGSAYLLHEQKVHLLNTQYRMDPAILQFPNQRFYNKRIRSGENVLSRSPQVRYPFRFIDTHGQGREEREGNYSFKNSYEVAVIKNLLKTDKDIAVILGANESARVIIITPYKAQAKLLQNATTSLGLSNLQVSTVDSFQGQEGEIVILCTVRTKSVGFVDDNQRLNVALTRSKRVLRVVGDRAFFQKLRDGSTLRALAIYSGNSGNAETTKLRSIPTCPPDLSITTQWKLTFTRRFHSVIANLEPKGKNILLNTLSALALPDVHALGNRVVEKEGWHTSWLKGYSDYRVIWVARKHEPNPIVEAHFAGRKEECLRFRQKNHIPPDGCCAPQADMCGIRQVNNQATTQNGRLFVSWPLNEHVQNAILSERIDNLPHSMIQLDPLQEAIAKSPPPLLIESRSGTGKTLVLLQHVAFYHHYSDTRPACFVTVSRRLCNELKERYEELTPIHGQELPATEFFCFQDFVLELLACYNIQEYDNKDKCTFQGYLLSRRSHQKISVEAHLLENEIGGVIMGSIVAAQQCAPLTRSQYLEDKRSNIDNTTDDGLAKRNFAFDVYESYSRWKSEMNKYDIHDAVILLLKEKPRQMFASAYLDEVQDLSHAAIFLICSLAGKDNHYWVCGGDPAQMISPGCSFTFNGLKETLCAAGCNFSELRQVDHLLINYRTTKDILMLGNEILTIARKYFPGRIEFAHPERAIKDIGIKVAIAPWRESMRNRVKFGDNQCFIYSTNGGEDDMLLEARNWLNDHPFILSSLDSKGLEFDDVVVAFAHDDRKVWQPERKLEASLSLLRELYVAVTRAQRRVVILVRENLSTMTDFFENLNIDLQKCDGTVWQEFDRDTSAEQWYEKAQGLFKCDQFELAATCFARAERQDWSLLARARKLLEDGLKEEACVEFRRAARAFYDGQEFKQVLTILQRLLGLERKMWVPTDDKIFSAALDEQPFCLPRIVVVEFAILREDFSSLSVCDLTDPSVAKLLQTYRAEDWMKQLVARSSDQDRDTIASSIPSVVFDYHFERHNFHAACGVAVSACLYDDIDKATLAFMEVTRIEWVPDNVVRYVKVLEQISESSSPSAFQSPSVLLKRLFQSPKQLPRLLRNQCNDKFGRNVVILAVDRSGLERTALLDFSTTDFKAEVETAVVADCRPYAINVVRWYDRNGYPRLASEFAKDRIQLWSNDDLFRIVISLKPTPKRLFKELEKRGLLDVSLVLAVLSPYIKAENKTEFIQAYLQYLGRKREFSLDIMTDKCRRDLKDVLARMTRKKQFLEKVFLQVYLDCDLKMLLCYSLDALDRDQTALTPSNITGLFRLWEEAKHFRRGVVPDISTRTFEEKSSFLMCLFFGVEPTDLRRNLFLEHQDPFLFLLMAVGPTAAAYCRIHQSDETGSQDNGLIQQLAAFHGELKESFNSVKTSKSMTAENSTYKSTYSAEEGEDKNLSKRAQRKQKQAARKQQTKQTTADSGQKMTSQTAGSGKGKKKQNRKNNKKKRGRK